MGEFDRCRFFNPSPMIFRESAHKSREARFMVLVVKPCPMPSLERSLHRKVKEATQRASLENNASNNLSVIVAWFVFQKEVILKQREIRRDP